MGGEKLSNCLKLHEDLGSPPRGRGKVDAGIAEIEIVGITPAWAGKRRVLSVPIRSTQDHPRIGGEKPDSPFS